MASPLAPVLSPSGSLLGWCSPSPSGSPDPLLASVLLAAAKRQEEEERRREAIRSGEAPLLPSGSWLISDRD
jgi:hypothetical protein